MGTGTAMSDNNEPEIQPAERPDDRIVPPEQDPEAGYPTSEGVVTDEEADEGKLPPLGQELEAD